MRRAAAVLLVGCLGAGALPSCAPLPRPRPEPPPPPPPLVAAPAPPPASATRPLPRTAERERQALDLRQRGDLAQALIAWQILQALDPRNPEYLRQIDATRSLIRHRVEQHLQAGDEAFSSGTRELAQLEYLKALALDPWGTEPLERLRGMERERALAAQSERLAKLNREQRSADRRGGGGKASSRAPGRQERDYLETGIALFQQGKYEESVLEIQKYLQAFPEDAEARRYVSEARRQLGNPSAPPTARPKPVPQVPQAPPPAPPAVAPPARDADGGPRPVTAADRALAQESYEKGLRATRSDLAQAIQYFEQALRKDPDHLPSRLQLERSRRMQRNLE